MPEKATVEGIVKLLRKQFLTDILQRMTDDCLQLEKEKKIDEALTLGKAAQTLIGYIN